VYLLHAVSAAVSLMGETEQYVARGNTMAAVLYMRQYRAVLLGTSTETPIFSRKVHTRLVQRSQLKPRHWQ
jgi:hypothetical protein